jgi:hypothetical protein
MVRRQNKIGLDKMLAVARKAATPDQLKAIIEVVDLKASQRRCGAKP